MRVFKWTFDFDSFFETPIAAVWYNLHALTIHYYDDSMLFSIRKLFGEPIQVDHNIATRARLSYARICVEIDISKPVPEKYMIRVEEKDVTLQVKCDKVPQYCSSCKHVGHLEEHCYAFGKRPAPPKKDFTRPYRQTETTERQGGTAPWNTEGESRREGTMDTSGKG
ncbi:hypothetical protein AAHA92_14993 [Salvia divinorum]|uniref:DUF4283 domain-containing protein n=1 Tax=Salvia divinorum TaxID=28513 RepID=A0ABD1HDB2_SALDI